MDKKEVYIALVSPYWCHIVPEFSPERAWLARAEDRVLVVPLDIRPFPRALSVLLPLLGYVYMIANMVGIWYDLTYLWVIDTEARCYVHEVPEGVIALGELILNLTGYLCVALFWVCILLVAIRTVRRIHDFYRYTVFGLPRNRRLAVAILALLFAFGLRLIVLSPTKERYGRFVITFFFTALAPLAISIVDILSWRGEGNLKNLLIPGVVAFVMVSVRIAIALPFDCNLERVGSDNVTTRIANGLFKTSLGVIVSETVIACFHHIKPSRWWVPALYTYRRRTVSHNHLAEKTRHTAACCRPGLGAGHNSANYQAGAGRWRESDLELDPSEDAGAVMLNDIDVQDVTDQGGQGLGATPTRQLAEPADSGEYHCVMYCSPKYCHVVARGHTAVRYALESDAGLAHTMFIELRPLGWRLKAYYFSAYFFPIYTITAVIVDLSLVYPRTYDRGNSCVDTSGYDHTDPWLRILPTVFFGVGCLNWATAVIAGLGLARRTLRSYHDIRVFMLYALRNNVRLIVVSVLLFVSTIVAYVFGGAMVSTSDFRVADLLFGIVFSIALLVLSVADLAFLRASYEVRRHMRAFICGGVMFCVHVYLEHQIQCGRITASQKDSSTLLPGEFAYSLFRTMIGFASVETLTVLFCHLRNSEWWCPSSIRFQSASSSRNYRLRNT